MAGIGSMKPVKLVDETPTKSGANWLAGNVTILNTWAEVKVKNATRVVQGNQVVLDKFFEFRFRYRGDIELNANVRLIYNGKKYAVQSLTREDEKNFYWKLLAEAKTFN